MSAVLFTTNFPFVHTGGEVMFVAPELSHLVRRFGRVRVVPLHDRGDMLPLPPGVEVDRSLARSWRSRTVLHQAAAWCWPGLWAELKRAAREGGWVGVARAWRWAAVAQATWRWAAAALPAESLHPQLLYTYWRGGQTLAMLRWAREPARRACAVVTRVHGYELYRDRFSPPFQPWEQAYGQLDAVLAISDHGVRYLRALGVPPARVRLARLGVPQAPLAPASPEPRLRRIVSCSAVSVLKRVDLVAQALCLLAQRHPDWTLAWQHFGDGPQMGHVKALLARAPANLQATLHGQRPHAEVLRRYAQEPIDLFVLLSRHEGLPVSVQEALAAGIPVLATDVGGTAEAVGGPEGADNGLLLPADPEPAEVVRALETLLVDTAEARGLARRRAARARWAADFDADRNHAATAQMLHTLATRTRTPNES